MNQPLVWVIGSKGMLGTQVVLELRRQSIPFLASDLETDIRNASALDAFIGSRPVNVIINCSAYTAVDNAETEEQKAAEINGYACKNIALAAKKKQAALIHFSTDYVFDGTAKIPYTETDPTGPMSVYGKTKLLGENLIRETWDRHLILRISWLYGVFGNNFVKTILKLLAEKPKLSIVADQIGCPTYAGRLAEKLTAWICSKKEAWGIYHYSDEGALSWYDFACVIKQQAFARGIIRTEVPVLPITTAEYPKPAKRPAYSVLSKAKIASLPEFIIDPWEKNLNRYFLEMGELNV